MILIGINVEFPKGFEPKRGEASRLMGKWRPAAGLAAAMARHIRDRVMKQAKSPDTAKRYATGSGRFVGSRYPFGAGATQNIRGVVRYEDSKAFHDALGARRGTFDVSGGMWRGLTVRVLSENRVKIEFRGRSIGQEPGRSGKGRKVSNSLKARTVWGTSSVHVLAMNANEIRSMETAVSISLARTVAPAFGIEDTRTQGSFGNPRLTRAMITAIRNGTRTVR